MTVLRWILAVIAGVTAYWVGLLLTLGVLAMALHTVVTPEDTGRSVVLLSIALFAGTFAGAIAAIGVAPPAGRRTMGLLVLAVATIWAVYGQWYAHHPLPAAAAEVLAAVLGAVLAWLLGRRMSQG